MSVISSLFYNKSSVSNFKEKTELFNEYFSKQYSWIQNGSTILSVLHL